MFINGIFKKRRASNNSPVTTANTSLAPLVKRMRSDGVDDEDSDSNSASMPATPVDNSPMLASTSSMFAQQNPTIYAVQSAGARGAGARTVTLQVHTPDMKKEGRDLNVTSAAASVRRGSVAVQSPPKQQHQQQQHQQHQQQQQLQKNSNDPPLDFNWNAILLQDIDVGSSNRVKLEESIDNIDHAAANNIADLSPPPSDSNSDVSIEDLLNNAAFVNDLENPIDFESGQPLDLSISGMSLKPPEWWGDSLNDSKGLLGLVVNATREEGNGLHTPVMPHSPIDDGDSSHPWHEAGEMAFDTDITDLFNMSDLQGP